MEKEELRERITVVPETREALELLETSLMKKYGSSTNSLLQSMAEIHYQDLEEYLDIRFGSIGDKYSDERGLWYKGHYYSVYCAFKQPRIGGITYLFEKTERDLGDYKSIGEELAELLIKTLGV